MQSPTGPIRVHVFVALVDLIPLTVETLQHGRRVVVALEQSCLATVQNDAIESRQAMGSPKRLENRRFLSRHIHDQPVALLRLEPTPL